MAADEDEEMLPVVLVEVLVLHLHLLMDNFKVCSTTTHKCTNTTVDLLHFFEELLCFFYIFFYL